MDFLNKAMSQLADLFKSMSPGSRITAGMLVVAIVVSLTYLFVFQVNTASEFLFGSREFSQPELDAMVSAFAAANLDKFHIVGHRIQVPRAKLVDYLQALSDSNFLPQNFDSPIDQAIASSNSMIDSKPLQDYKFIQAKQKKLGQVISAFTGVEAATVQYQENKREGFPPVTERKTTVAVRAKNGGKLEPGLVQAVRTAASGWFGVTAEDVTIIDLNGNVTFGGDLATREPEGPRTPYADAKRWYENYWKDKIRDCLAVYPGIKVGVNVELDPELDNESRKVTVDTQPTALETNTYRKTSENRPTPGGRPGAVPNEVASNTPRDITTQSRQEATLDENRERQVNAAGHELSTHKKASLIPTTVRAIVLVPSSYFTRLWEQRNPTPAGEKPKAAAAADLQTIEKQVTETITKTVDSTLPPLTAGETVASRVEVRSYDDLPPPVIEPPTMVATASAWLADNWHSLALVGVGLVCLVMLRSMIRSGAPATPVAAAAATAAPALSTPAKSAEEPAESESEAEPTILARRAPSTGASLRDELTAMVRDDPDAAANVLRTWIGDAA
jgi:flagellar M-ring protein FliF